MDFERRQANMMRVGKPAQFARPLPGMLARGLRQLAVRGGPHLRARPVETDAHWRASRQRKHGRAELAMHVDHKVITRRAQICGELRRIGKWPQPPGLRPFAAGKFDDVVDPRMVPQQLGDLRRCKPVDARRRIALAQFVKHRDRVQHVADRRQLDQQDALEVAHCEIGRRQCNHRKRFTLPLVGRVARQAKRRRAGWG